MENQGLADVTSAGRGYRLADRRDVVMTIRIALTGTLSGGYSWRRHNPGDTHWAVRQAEAIADTLESANLWIICGPAADWHSTPGQPAL